MKTNIKYAIMKLLFWIIVLAVSLIGLIVTLADIGEAYAYAWGAIGLGIIFLISVTMLLIAAQNMQWFDIADGYITVHSPFGIVKRVQLSDIKKAFKTKASGYNIKALSMNRVHIVLCLKKSITKSSISDAYNRKKNPYIIIPYTTQAENFICSAYNKACEHELIIK